MPRGRKPGFRMSDEHRVKIQNSNVLNALIEHVVGKREMSSTQVTAGVALMRKVLPDLTAVDATVSGQIDHKHDQVANDANAFYSRIAGLASRGGETEGAGKPH